jgi:hypothetical protein
MKIYNDSNHSDAIRGLHRAMAASANRGAGSKPRGMQPDRSASSAISTTAKLMAGAASDLHAELDVRPDAVDAAREQVRNWSGLDEQQVGTLAGQLLADLF